MYVRLCLLPCIRVYLILLVSTYVHICTYNATYFSHVIKNLTHAQIILFGVQICIRLLLLAY